jgi:hypothetical protein
MIGALRRKCAALRSSGVRSPRLVL